jgi:hypothetical protein
MVDSAWQQAAITQTYQWLRSTAKPMRIRFQTGTVPTAPRTPPLGLRPARDEPA